MKTLFIKPMLTGGEVADKLIELSPNYWTKYSKQELLETVVWLRDRQRIRALEQELTTVTVERNVLRKKLANLTLQ